MFGKNKYDVMKKEMKGMYLTVVKLVPKLLSLSSKIKKEKINEDAAVLEAATMMEEVMPIIIKASHLIYENAKDLENIEKETLFTHLRKKGINPATFSFNYNYKKNEMAKILMVLAILEKENIQIPSFKDPSIALKLLSGDGINGIISEVMEDISYESMNTIEIIVEDDFQVSQLDEEETELLEGYHNKYMSERIFPHVTKNTPDKDILKRATSIGKKAPRK